MEYFLGEIQLFPYGFAPRDDFDWIPCNGQILQIDQNQGLFSLLGNVYGGDGRTTFALPNLQRAAPGRHNQYYIALSGLYPRRS